VIVADSSPLIVFARINRLDILKAFFSEVYIPASVYQEVVVETIVQQQRDTLTSAIVAATIIVRDPTMTFSFTRRLGKGEQGVLNLAREIDARAIIMDDKKARNEAKELKFSLFYTTDILRGAEQRGLLTSYADIMVQLRAMSIYLPG